MFQVSGKVLVAVTAGSIALAIAPSAYAKPNPREAEAARIEMQRAAQLRHAREMRATARRSQAVPLSNSRPPFGWPSLVTEARKYIGTNPTAMQRRWCARFLNLVLNKTGYRGTNSDAARSFASYGRRISEPRIGAIAVLSRGKNRSLGHVGIVTGVDANGNPMIISGNHGRRVAESIYPRGRVIAYVMPTDGPPMTRVAAAGSGAAAPVRAHETGGLTSPIDELLAAINAEASSRSQPRARPVAQPQPTMQLAAQTRQRPPEQRVATPMPHGRAAQAAPGLQGVPQLRPAPYRIVQQATSPAPMPDPRRVVVR